MNFQVVIRREGFPRMLCPLAGNDFVVFETASPLVESRYSMLMRYGFFDTTHWPCFGALKGIDCTVLYSVVLAWRK